MKRELNTIKSEWIDETIKWLKRYKRRNGIQSEWSTDWLHVVVPTQPPCPNYYGALIARMKKMGLIEEAGYKRSTRPSANGRRILMWRLK